MPKNHLQFHSQSGKRQILVVDDEMINRELLGAILEEQYSILYAADGCEALEVIRREKDMLSLVLLDVLMPRMDGLELLSVLKAEHILDCLPVIVLTSDSTLEVKSLSYGATDFIPKPYPQADVILARVLRTIELNEDRDIIRSTERDSLTGLYNREYFYRYAEQLDQFHQQLDMDAIVLDINHFHLINERSGKAYADELLRRVGQRLLELKPTDIGIICRHSADMFMLYLPHGQDCKKLLELASIPLSGDGGADQTRLRLRMGVYPSVDKTIDIERRFDRAKNAADTVRNSVTRNLAYYDNSLHERELYREQLIDNFDEAIREGQFQVYYQPKFDLRPDEPQLASAEALVRWKHPRLGMISPGEFIPLFEENGLIQRLDAYVWRRAAEQVRAWKERLHFSVPVSVNVSRVDMFDPGLVETFREILAENGLTPTDYYLEITESAYTENAEQIIDTVNRLRGLGFRIEMDDFGTGYSSLNVISSLPIDALKLDMQFIRTAFSGQKDTRMIEAIIDIASYLSVPVIAEGVETEEQMRCLKAMGCDLAQGFYFSRALPAEEYERFIIERRSSAAAGYTAEPERLRRRAETRKTIADIAYALSSSFANVFYINTVTGRYTEYAASEANGRIRLRETGDNFFTDRLPGLLTRLEAEDRDKAAQALQQQALARLAGQKQADTVDCRLAAEGGPLYYRLKLVPVVGASDESVVIGLENVDEQTRREMQYQRELGNARNMALRDALTGVKSKLAFKNAEEDWNTRIREGLAEPFAVAFFDINGLKRVNDSRGHAAGDRYIREACSIICNIFKHSPVFRIGGDEFAAILSGGDYDSRDALFARLEQINRDHRGKGEVTISYGTAEADLATDTGFSGVVERADAAMYAYKKRCKVER